jgi:DNA-binding MarR family transcriptional regulator
LNKLIIMKIEDAIRSNFENNQQKAYINLIYTANEINTVAKKLFKAFDVTLQQYNVLRILKGKHPKSVNPGDIKLVMLDKSPDLTRLVDRLLSKGLVTRETCEVNRRKIDIKISDKGLAFLLETNSEVITNQNSITKSLTDKEAIQLSDLLDKLRTSL